MLKGPQADGNFKKLSCCPWGNLWLELLLPSSNVFKLLRRLSGPRDYSDMLLIKRSWDYPYGIYKYEVPDWIEKLLDNKSSPVTIPQLHNYTYHIDL